MSHATEPTVHDKTNSDHGMSLTVKTMAGWISGFILLFGVYVVLYGHETPGGGFAGGVVIASSFIVLRLAFGHLAICGASQRSTAILASTGALMFLGMAAAGIFVGNTFFESFIGPSDHSRSRLFSAVFILVCEIAIALIVAMSVFRIFSVLAHSNGEQREEG